MEWWTSNVDMSWLGSMTTWWILGPVLIVLASWAAIKLSQRAVPRIREPRRA